MFSCSPLYVAIACDAFIHAMLLKDGSRVHNVLTRIEPVACTFADTPSIVADTPSVAIACDGFIRVMLLKDSRRIHNVLAPTRKQLALALTRHNG